MRFKIISSIFLLVFSVTSFAQDQVFRVQGNSEPGQQNSNHNNSAGSSNAGNNSSQHADDIDSTVLQFLFFMYSEDPDMIVNKIGLSELSAANVYEILKIADSANGQLLGERTAAMCQKWRDSPAGDKQRAQEALNAYSASVNSQKHKVNELYQNVLSDIYQILSADEIEDFETYLNYSRINFGTSAVGTFPDRVRLLNAGEVTMSHNCGN